MARAKNVLKIRTKLVNPKRHVVGYRLSDNKNYSANTVAGLAMDKRIEGVTRVVDSPAFSRAYITTTRKLPVKVLRGKDLYALK